jgi:flavoprotein
MQYSNCFHGTLSPTIMTNTLERFREEFDEHALRHRCPARVCESLIRYRVASSTPAVGTAATICPTDAIVQAKGGWQIDDAKCIRCDACRDIAPDDIIIEDRYTDAVPLRVVAQADVARAGG